MSCINYSPWINKKKRVERRGQLLRINAGGRTEARQSRAATTCVNRRPLRLGTRFHYKTGNVWQQNKTRLVQKIKTLGF